MGKQSVATHHDAELILKLYDLRREERMRAARDWFLQKFSPRSIDDVRALAGGTPENASYRMVTTYWDMAASFISHGILDASLFLESGGEMLVVWAKLEHVVPAIRAETNPRLLINVEKVVEMSPSAQERMKSLRTRFAPKK
ncbi:MAG: hypothetical protein ABI682_10365 [Acidobacteriota bacterium]